MMDENDPNYPRDIFTAGMNLIRSTQRAAGERNLRANDKKSVNDKNERQKPDSK